MTPAEATDMYRRQIDEHGRTVTFKRVSPALELDAKARVFGYKPDELVGGIKQGDRRIVVMAEDITFDGGLKSLDLVFVDGRKLTIDIVDSNTRRVGETLIAYELTARG